MQPAAWPAKQNGRNSLTRHLVYTSPRPCNLLKPHQSRMPKAVQEKWAGPPTGTLVRAAKSRTAHALALKLGSARTQQPRQAQVWPSAFRSRQRGSSPEQQRGRARAGPGSPVDHLHQPPGDQPPSTPATSRGHSAAPLYAPCPAAPHRKGFAHAEEQCDL